MSHLDQPDYVFANREFWDGQADQYAKRAVHAWQETSPSWGIYSVPEANVHMIPNNIQGMDVVELGCGTAYVSAWLHRLGAKPTGIDNSPKQLETARKLQIAHQLDFPLHLGNAETTPFADESFDFAISEYGASIWCDPYKWLPEAARILRPGGLLHFLKNSTLIMLCTGPEFGEDDPASVCLQRPLFGMHRFDWLDTNEVEFHLPPGKMIAALRDAGFEILEMIEVEVPPGGTTNYQFAPIEWVQRWPVEEIWKVRKRD